jgi:hypothetical protein
MKRKMNYFLTPAYSIPEDTPFKRIGIIPYFKENEMPNFFLMLDSKFKELTDCGGIPKPNEKWLETAIRETEEESRNKFSFSPEQILNEGNVFWREDHRIAIIFINVSNIIPTKINAAETCYMYRVDYIKGIIDKDKRHRLENSDMFFYDIKETLSLAKQYGRMYMPVRLLLLKFIYRQMEEHLP